MSESELESSGYYALYYYIIYGLIEPGLLNVIYIELETL